MARPIHYRYRDILSAEGILIIEDSFRVIKETECGYWVQIANGTRPDLTEEMISRMTAKATRPCNVRWVSKDSSRRYCYPSKADAMEAFRHRKLSQLAHARSSIAKAEQSIAAATTLLTVGDCLPRDSWSGSIMAGMPPHFSGVEFY